MNNATDIIPSTEKCPVQQENGYSDFVLGLSNKIG
jgi:hypothetical protein